MHKLIIISGSSCTGKTTLGKHIADKLEYPLYSKDAIKELLFDALGWKDLAWSKQLGGASMSLLYFCLEESLKRKQSVIIEANFKPKVDGEKIKTLADKYRPKVTELHCYAEPAVLIERFIKRSESEERHPGHLDHENYELARQTYLNTDLHSALSIGQTIEIDATDFAQVDYSKIIAELIK